VTAEVAKQQAEAEGERKLREAELVLPKYEALLQAVHATTSAVDRCSSEINTYLLQQRGWGSAVGTGSFMLDGSTVIPIEPALVESCSQIEATIGPLQLSLDQALLVSNELLGAAASQLASGVEIASDTAQRLLDAIQVDTEFGAFVAIDEIDLRGRSFYEVVEDLGTELASATPATITS
jgi:hypothetical protein